MRWSVNSDEEDRHPLPEGHGSFGVSRSLVSLASLAIQARDPTRFDRLYRLVWRANAGERVLERTDDETVRLVQRLAFAVRAETHRMRTMLRYLPMPEKDGDPLSRLSASRRIVLQANAQLIARQFPGLTFSILTPDGGAHWDNVELTFSAGVARKTVPDDGRCEAGGGRITNVCCNTRWKALPCPRRNSSTKPPASGPRAARSRGAAVAPRRAAARAMQEASDCRRCQL